MVRASLLAAATFGMVATASAEPGVKVVNFTAEWCYNCLVLTPNINEAVVSMETDEVSILTVDMTDLRGKGQDVKWQTVAQLKDLTEQHKVRYLWDWYGGYTGLATIVAADTGEPISCLEGRITPQQIRAQIHQAVIIARQTPEWERMPLGAECPAPKRPQRNPAP